MNFSEDVNCCGKVNPIHKIEAIKIIYQSREVITDFKHVYNKEFKLLVNHYNLCLKDRGDSLVENFSFIVPNRQKSRSAKSGE